jgi:hypothetical protein
VGRCVIAGPVDSPCISRVCGAFAWCARWRPGSARTQSRWMRKQIRRLRRRWAAGAAMRQIRRSSLTAPSTWSGCWRATAYAERLLGRGAAGRFQGRIYGIMLERCRAQLHGFNGEHEFQCAHPARDAVMLHRAFDQRKKKRLPRGAGAAFCVAGTLTVTGSVEFPARTRWC